jgi:hypothetical protein
VHRAVQSMRVRSSASGISPTTTSACPASVAGLLASTAWPTSPAETGSPNPSVPPCSAGRVEESDSTLFIIRLYPDMP